MSRAHEQDVDVLIEQCAEHWGGTIARLSRLSLWIAFQRPLTRHRSQLVASAFYEAAQSMRLTLSALRKIRTIYGLPAPMSYDPPAEDAPDLPRDCGCQESPEASGEQGEESDPDQNKIAVTNTREIISHHLWGVQFEREREWINTRGIGVVIKHAPDHRPAVYFVLVIRGLSGYAEAAGDLFVADLVAPAKAVAGERRGMTVLGPVPFHKNEIKRAGDCLFDLMSAHYESIVNAEPERAKQIVCLPGTRNAIDTLRQGIERRAKGEAPIDLVIGIKTGSWHDPPQLVEVQHEGDSLGQGWVAQSMGRQSAVGFRYQRRPLFKASMMMLDIIDLVAPPDDQRLTESREPQGTAPVEQNETEKWGVWNTPSGVSSDPATNAPADEPVNASTVDADGDFARSHQPADSSRPAGQDPDPNM